MRVGSAAPQRESALVYSLPVGGRPVVSHSFVASRKKRRTHLREGAFAPVDGPAERGEVQPRSLIRETNHRIESLRQDPISGSILRDSAQTST